VSREFITLLGGVAVAWPLAARSSAGQQNKAVKPLPRVGILEPYAEADPGYRMRQTLHDVGLVDGRDVAVEWRYAEGIRRVFRRWPPSWRNPVARLNA